MSKFGCRKRAWLNVGNVDREVGRVDRLSLLKEKFSHWEVRANLMSRGLAFDASYLSFGQVDPYLHR